jgi:surface polysaccharide O-acyltransferase-like enzyme
MAARHQGVDAMRFALCFAVVLLHAMPASDLGAPPIWAMVVGSLCRGAVPFFFVASGYYLRLPDRITPQLAIKPLRRLGPPYLAWVLIYTAVDYLAWGSVPDLGPRTLLTGGDAFHLWFLPALGVALVLVPAAILLLGNVGAVLLCGTLAAASIALGGYRGALELPEVGATRLMVAPLLVLIGSWLARRSAALPASVAIPLVIAAWGASLVEEATIAWLDQAPLRSHPIVISTLALGTLFFLLARALPAGRRTTAVAPLAAISLGIYASHLLFVRAFGMLIGSGTPERALAVAVLAFAAATLLSWLLARTRFTRFLVR